MLMMMMDVVMMVVMMVSIMVMLPFSFSEVCALSPSAVNIAKITRMMDVVMMIMDMVIMVVIVMVNGDVSEDDGDGTLLNSLLKCIK